MPPTITDGTPIITRPTNSRRPRILPPTAAKLLLAAAILALGLPSAIGEFRRLSAEPIASALEQGVPVGLSEIESALPLLESASANSPSARLELGLALLARAEEEPSAEGASRAAQEFRTYLGEVPGDTRAWLFLARAEQRQGRLRSALRALQMSILTGPSMAGLEVARAALGLDLYPMLNEEARQMLEHQFLLAADRNPIALARLARQRHAVLIVRIMLADGPEEMAKFEKMLDQTPG